MRNKLPLVLVSIIAACSPPAERHWTAADQTAIRNVMSEQEAAWDRGDIDGFMAGYTDSVCFVSSRGTTCGKAGVTANYRKNYPDKAAMGDLSFTHLDILAAGADHAWCTGRWQLVRTADTLNGGFSLLWQRRTDGWRILRDHSY